MSQEPGWLYILSNPAMPGLCKVGMTTRTPEERAAELYDTGTPAPYEVAAAWPVDDVRAAERDAHDRLARYRVSDAREWFRLTADQAIDVIFPNPPTRAPKRRPWRLVRGVVEGVGWVSVAVVVAAVFAA